MNTFKRRLVYLLALLVFLHAVFSLYRIITTSAPDFSVYYSASKALLQHENIYTIPMFTGLGYPSFTLLATIPLAVLPYQGAQATWVILSFLLFLLCIYLSLQVVHKVSIYHFCLVFIFSFLAFPTKFTLGMGQINFIALTLLLVSLRSASGVLFGFAVVMKPHLFLIAPAYGVRKAIAALGTVWIAVLVTGAVFGFWYYSYYIAHTLPPLLVFAGRDIYYNQGVGSFFSRLFPNDMSQVLTYLISALLGICAWLHIARYKLTLPVSVLVSIPLFLLVEPLSWQHHYVFLLPVFVWLFWKTKFVWLLFVSYVLIAINIPHSPTLFHSHVFVGNCILFWLMLYETRRGEGAAKN